MVPAAVSVGGESRIKMRSLSAEFMLRQEMANDIFTEGYVPKPIKFAAGLSPREHQTVAAELWKATGSLLLADDLGTGKTVSILAAIADPKLRPACVAVPTHLTRQWGNQSKRFLPGLKSHVIEGMQPYDLHVISDCPHCEAVVDHVYDRSVLKCVVRFARTSSIRW